MKKKIDHNNQESSENVLEKLGELFEGTDYLIYISDPDTYEILFANKELKELAGDEVLGKKCYEVVHDLSRPCSFCTNKHIFGENLGKTYIWEKQDRRNKRWYKCIDKAIEWSDGRHVRFEMATDITKQKQMQDELQSERHRFHKLFNLTADPVVIVDSEGKFLEITEGVKEITGYERQELLGKNFFKTDIATPRSKTILQKNLAKRMRGEDIAPYEIEVLTKDGKKLAFEVNAVKIEYQGKPADMIVFRDLRERKKLQKELAESEEKYRNLYQNARDVIVTFDLEGNITSINRAIEEYGFKEDELIGKSVFKFVPKEYHPKIRKDFAEIERGKPTGGQIEIITPKGKIFAEYRSNPIRRGNKVTGIHMIMRDIAERKRFEERLSALNIYGRNLNKAKDMEEIYNLTLKAMDSILGFEYASILMLEEKEKKLRLVSQFGYSNQLSLNLRLDGEKGVTVKAAKTGKSIMIPDIRKEEAYLLGKPGMLSELAVPIKAGKQVLGVLNVESENLAAFDEEDQELLEILASHAATAINNLKSRERLRTLSKRLQYLMRSTTEMMDIEDTHQRLEVIAEAIRKFGWRRVVISLRDQNLEGTDLVTVGLNQEEIRLLLERKAPGHVWRERLGPKFKRFKIGEFYYLPWSDPWIREKVHKVPSEAMPEEATTYTGVPSKLSPDQMVDWHPQDMVYAPLRTPDGKIVGILSMDDPVDGRKPTRETLAPLELFLHQAAIVIENAQLTERLGEARDQLQAYAEQLEQKVEERTKELQKSQEKLTKAQRLATIGELAGMVGHDLRNPLTSINAAAYYLKKRLSSKIDGKVKEMLHLIENNISYSNKIINDLLDYSKEIKLDLSETSPKSIVTRSLSLVEVPQNVEVVNLTTNKPKIKVDIAKINRAFINIIKNAFDAMPKGGTLTIKSKQSNDNLDFEFSDTGEGMSRETMEKLWTPLFTTKAKGMGFGLAICKRNIEAHGGSVSVESSLGKGTTVKVTIPVKPKKEGGEKIWVETPESSLLTTTKT